MPASFLHSPRITRSQRGWAFYVLITVVITLGLLAIVGETYEAIARHRDQNDFRRWGELIDVGGFDLNLNCLGTGTPTVILDSGLGMPGAEWALVQPDVAEFTRVCSYDRAGYGWSNPGPMPRTSAEISRELHLLLRNGHIAPPYIVVGHSFGGHNMRVFTHAFPDEVAALVLVEAAHENQSEKLPPQITESDKQQSRSLHHWQPIVPVLIHLGIQRLVLESQPRRGVPGDVARELRYLQLNSNAYDAMVAEIDGMPQSIEEVRNSGFLGNRPLLVLTGANAGEHLPPQFDREAFRRIWITDLQASLAKLSTRGQQIMVPNAGRDVPLQQPQAVVNAIRRAVTAVRGK